MLFNVVIEVLCSERPCRLIHFWMVKISAGTCRVVRDFMNAGHEVTKLQSLKLTRVRVESSFDENNTDALRSGGCSKNP